MTRRARQRGFTLLEILVATAIMGIAIAGVLSGLASASRNASRITEYDRAAMLAQIKMDELIANDRAPRNVPLTGLFGKQESGGVDAGWQANISLFESKQGQTRPGQSVLDRIVLEIWWMDGVTRRTYSLEGYRRVTVGPGGVQ